MERDIISKANQLISEIDFYDQAIKSLEKNNYVKIKFYDSCDERADIFMGMNDRIYDDLVKETKTKALEIAYNYKEQLENKLKKL